MSCLQTERVVVLGGFHWHQQSRVYVIPADWDFAIVNHKTIPTMKVHLYPYIQAINLNLRRRCGQTEIVCHCSLLMLLAPAEQSIQLLISRATTSFISYHQLKTWSLLSKYNQSKSWEKVWANWYCLSLVTSHVVGTSRAEHTTSYMSYKQMKTLSS